MSDDKKLVVNWKPTICSTCRKISLLEYGSTKPKRTPPFRVTVTSAQIVDESWVTEGHIEIEGSHCPNCGTVLTAIERAIPIQCVGFTCPVCHTDADLSYEVTQVDNEDLEFTATIQCAKCKEKKKLSKWLKRIFSIVKIKIGPVGIDTQKLFEEDK